MIIGIGTDIVSVERIKNAIDKYGKRFVDRIFTETEQKYSDQFGDKSGVHYSARFAAKESFSKAIGTGITQGFKFSEIEIENLPSGEPKLNLYGGMHEKYSHYKILVTLSHTDEYAVAFVVIEEAENKNEGSQ
jgi:holo-[acyl-carrier protein] synthase